MEELLRYTSPVNHATSPFTAETVKISGTLDPRARGGAGRDRLREPRSGPLPRPPMLDLGRDAGGNLAFGHGIHYCLGAPLARMEA